MRLTRLHPIKFSFSSTRSGDNEQIQFIDMSHSDELKPLIGTDVPAETIEAYEHLKWAAEKYADNWQSGGALSWTAIDPDSGEGVAARWAKNEALAFQIRGLQATLTEMLCEPYFSTDVEAAAKLIHHLKKHADGGSDALWKAVYQGRDKCRADKEFRSRLVLSRSQRGYRVAYQLGRIHFTPGKQTGDIDWEPLDTERQIIAESYTPDAIARAIVADVSNRKDAPDGGWVLVVDWTCSCGRIRWTSEGWMDSLDARIPFEKDRTCSDCHEEMPHYVYVSTPPADEEEDLEDVEEESS